MVVAVSLVERDLDGGVLYGPGAKRELDDVALDHRSRAQMAISTFPIFDDLREYTRTHFDPGNIQRSDNVRLEWVDRRGHLRGDLSDCGGGRSEDEGASEAED